jgi:hypothetical protein
MDAVMVSRKTLFVTLSLLLAVAVLAGDTSACPNCKGTVESSAADGANGGPGASPSLPGGFNVSIYLMLAGLFGVMGMVAGVIVRGVRATNAGMTQGANTRRGFPVKPEATSITSQ